MRLLSVLGGLATLVEAHHVVASPKLRFDRRDVPADNGATAKWQIRRFSNETTSIASTVSITSSTLDSTATGSAPTITTSSGLPSFTLTSETPSSSLNSTSIPSITVTASPSQGCFGTLTYDDLSTTTIYSTVTQQYNTTVTNITAPLTVFVESPPPYCSSTWIPGTSTACMFGNCYILPPTTTSFSAVFYSSPLATSVVTVTKKTPGVQALPETPPPNFGGSTSSRTPAPTKGNVAAETPAGVPPGGDSGESDSGNSAAGNGGMPSSGITDGSGLDFGSGSSSSGISGGGASSSSSTGSGAGSGSPASSSPSSSDSDSSGTSPAGGSGPGNSDSNTNSAGAGSAPGNFVAAGQPPITTTINHIQIIAGASTVQIGNQVVPISNSMQAPQTVVEDHQTFTIDASEVIGASTTLALTRAASEDATPTPVTVGSMTFSMDASEAIIGGTTFAVGFGAAPTTIVYQGTTISIGPEGVGIPSESTTIGGSETLPVSTTLPGGLDISVDASEVVISGTTYAIGAGAKSTTVVVGSDTLTMGPSGVGLQSTTIPPYTTSHATTATSKAVVATSTSTSGDNDTSSAATSNQSALRTVLSALLISVFVELRLV